VVYLCIRNPRTRLVLFSYGDKVSLAEQSDLAGPSRKFLGRPVVWVCDHCAWVQDGVAEAAPEVQWTDQATYMRAHGLSPEDVWWHHTTCQTCERCIINSRWGMTTDQFSMRMAVVETNAQDLKEALEIASKIERQDERDLTLLDIAKMQARSNQIQAALYTASRIVDATDQTAAMEAIAVGQLDAGDQTGALHTAKLIPAEINRSRVVMHIAIAQARSGNVQGAIETVKYIDDPLRRNMVLHDIAFTRAKDGDSPGALATARGIGSELGRGRAYRTIAAVQTQRGKMEQARCWINTLTSPIEKSSALLGVANGLLDNGGIPPDASYEQIHLVNPSRD